MSSEVTTAALQKVRRMAQRTRAVNACTNCKKMRSKCTGYFPCPRCKKLSRDCLPNVERIQAIPATARVDADLFTQSKSAIEDSAFAGPAGHLSIRYSGTAKNQPVFPRCQDTTSQQSGVLQSASMVHSRSFQGFGVLFHQDHVAAMSGSHRPGATAPPRRTPLDPFCADAIHRRPGNDNRDPTGPAPWILPHPSGLGSSQSSFLWTEGGPRAHGPRGGLRPRDFCEVDTADPVDVAAAALPAGGWLCPPRAWLEGGDGGGA